MSDVETAMNQLPEGALGRAIRSLRSERTPKMSQKQLGDEAKYEGGAGVTISRIENGLMLPSEERLHGIAEALDTSAGDLIALAEELHAKAAATPGLAGQARLAAPSGRKSKDRIRGIQAEVDRRTDRLNQLVMDFDTAHGRARDRFFLPFVEAAAPIKGAPEQPVATSLVEQSAATTVEDKAKLALQAVTSSTARAFLGAGGGAAAGFAVGGSSAYAAFTSTALLGTASTGTAISALSGAATTKATLSALGGGSLAAGGAGMAGGTMILTGIVAAPVAALTMGGLVWALRRTREQERTLRRKLDAAEQELQDSLPAFEATESVLRMATDLLSQIGAFGQITVRPWAEHLPKTRPFRFDDLSPQQQSLYEAFVQVAGCQVGLAQLDLPSLLTARGTALRQREKFTRAVLRSAEEIFQEQLAVRWKS